VPEPEAPGRPWWLIPALVVLAFFGAIFVIRAIIGFVAGTLTLMIAVAVIVALVFWFTKKD
jgi:hypothetical protein